MEHEFRTHNNQYIKFINKIKTQFLRYLHIGTLHNYIKQHCFNSDTDPS